MKNVVNVMYWVEASIDPYGGVNKQKWVALTKGQAVAVRNKYVNEGWGVVDMGMMV